MAEGLFSVMQPGDSGTAPPPAPLFLRAIGALIDLGIVAALFVLVGNYWGEQIEPSRWQVNGLPACGVMLFLPTYWLGPETWFGGTPGKLIVGLRVFSLAGSRLVFAQVLKRNVVKLVEFPTFYVTSAIAAFSNPLHQSVGDLWAKTMVTRAKSLETWRAGSSSPEFHDWLRSFSSKPTTPPEGPVA